MWRKRELFSFHSPYRFQPAFLLLLLLLLPSTRRAYARTTRAPAGRERTDAEWRWRWERRCGASLQTFPPECFTSLWPRRGWRAASCGEAAPCGHCAQPPPCPPVRPGYIDKRDGCVATATCAAVRNGRKNSQFCGSRRFKFGCNFGKIVKNFSITLKMLLKLSQYWLKW